MEYRITQDYHNPEFGFSLYEGEHLWDGDLEPDLTAQLVSSGVLVDAQVAEAVPVPKKRKSG